MFRLLFLQKKLVTLQTQKKQINLSNKTTIFLWKITLY